MLVPKGITGKTVGVLGLGLSGRAAIRSLAAAGADIFAFDDAVVPHTATADIRPAQFAAWQDWPWHQMALLVISPGIPHHHPTPHPAAAMAADQGIEIVSEVELALRAQPTAKLVAVTGTNGKSTTTALIGHCLKAAAISVAVGGNIGAAACSLDDPGPDGVLVLEMSSYQLEKTPSLAPDVAVILNISPDHLDRHGGMDGYIAAKAKILDQIKPDGIAVIGTGDPHVQALAKTCAARLIDCQIAEPASAPAAQRQSVSLAGQHNAENAAAAALAVTHLGVSLATINAAIASFESLPHRLQTVAACGNVRFVNDSKATNGAAAAKALGAFNDIYWVAGGLAKQDGIDPALPFLHSVKKAYLIGTAANAFAHSLAGKCPAAICGDLDTATRAAFKDARSADTGGTILLAPAAASFDQFANFGARGDAFASLARQLCTSDNGGQHA
jgi:UDP-N-acetylmuramoylalanine--D-glutamate ligase